MTQSKTKTVAEYLAELPSDRKNAITEIRKVILKNLPRGYEEAMTYGMIVYVVPLKTYLETYNKQPLCYAGLASQKNYMSLYLMSIYSSKETSDWFEKKYSAAGKKLNRGKSCIRFKNLEDLPLDVIGEAIARTPVKDFIAQYEQARK